MLSPPPATFAHIGLVMTVQVSRLCHPAHLLLAALTELLAPSSHLIQSSASAVSYQPPTMWYMEDRFQYVFARLSWCHSLLSVCLLPVACVLSILPALLYRPPVLPGDP